GPARAEAVNRFFRRACISLRGRDDVRPTRMATDCLHFFAPLIADTTASAPKLDTSTWVALVLGAVAVMYVMLRAKTRRERDPLERQAARSRGLAQQRDVE